MVKKEKKDNGEIKMIKTINQGYVIADMDSFMESIIKYYKYFDIFHF